jgi:hypothetical protein
MEIFDSICAPEGEMDSKIATPPSSGLRSCAGAVKSSRMRLPCGQARILPGSVAAANTFSIGRSSFVGAAQFDCPAAPGGSAMGVE